MVVESIFRSVAMSRDMERHHYTRVFEILDREIKPWLRYLDANAQDKFLTQVLSDMGKCALSIIREADLLNEIYVHSFCISALKKYSVFPLPKCHFYKFSRQVLSLLFLSKETKTLPTVKIGMSVLKTVACEFQVCAKKSLVLD
ncbi:PREDICTED: separase-like [Camelina sativa]|uniref:Separase-like n=1 Tax=Camelina sativa TaxID=90675 RepID=A0ABM1QQL8_CAMSA|nr:PREDICTED: separase-like [Camelina sativa]